SKRLAPSSTTGGRGACAASVSRPPQPPVVEELAQQASRNLRSRCWDSALGDRVPDHRLEAVDVVAEAELSRELTHHVDEHLAGLDDPRVHVAEDLEGDHAVQRCPALLVEPDQAT